MKALSGTTAVVDNKKHLQFRGANGWPLSEEQTQELEDKFGILSAPKGWGLPPFKDSEGFGVWAWEVSPKDTSIPKVTFLVYSDMFKKSGNTTRLFIWDIECVPETWGSIKAHQFEASVTALHFMSRQGLVKGES